MKGTFIFASAMVAAVAIAGGAVAAKYAFTRSRDVPATGKFVLSPSDAAVQDRGAALMSAGAAHISCDAAVGRTFACAPLADADVLASVKAGAAVYQRTVRFGIPPSSRQNAIFAKDEIQCVSGSDTALHCVSVALQRPTLSSEGDVVTYSPMKVSYDGSVPVVEAPGAPSIAAAP